MNIGKYLLEKQNDGTIKISFHNAKAGKRIYRNADLEKMFDQLFYSPEIEEFISLWDTAWNNTANLTDKQVAIIQCTKPDPAIPGESVPPELRIQYHLRLMLTAFNLYCKTNIEREDLEPFAATLHSAYTASKPA